MSVELIGIVSVGAALAGLALALGGLMLTLLSRTDRRPDGPQGELRALSRRVARLAGLTKASGLFRTA